MMLLSTGEPHADIEGENIVVTLPSGTDTVQIRLCLNHALALMASIQSQAAQAFKSGFAAPANAEVLAFQRGGKKVGRR